MISTDRADAHGSRRRTIILTLLVLVFLLGGIFLWRSYRTGDAQPPQRKALAVTALQVEAQEVPSSIEAVGTLTAVREVRLSPEVAGRVSAIGFTAGSNVRAGDLLVQLYAGPEQADRKAAQARAAFSTLQATRSEHLASTGAESRELLEQRRAEKNQADAAVSQLDARLIQKQVRAPFAGRIGIRRVNLGQYLNPGDAIATLTDLSSLFVEFAFPQQQIGLLRPGAAVKISSDSFPGRVFTARVNVIEPQIDADTRNVTVQAIMANPDHALRPGMYVTASLVLPPKLNAFVVPATAIQTSAQGDKVVVIRGEDARKGGRAEHVSVRTGQRIGDNVIISSGLKARDVVVTEGQLRLQPGNDVRVTRLLATGPR